MKRLLILAAAGLFVAGCSSSAGTSKPATTTSPAAAAPTSKASAVCKLKVGSVPDVISWEKVPRLPAAAQLLGGVDLGLCKYTSDQADLEETSPGGAGYCSVVASVKANPHYDIDALPAKKPKGILAQFGEGC